jgi:hypothetical protein
MLSQQYLNRIGETGNNILAPLNSCVQGSACTFENPYQPAGRMPVAMPAKNMLTMPRSPIDLEYKESYHQI